MSHRAVQMCRKLRQRVGEECSGGNLQTMSVEGPSPSASLFELLASWLPWSLSVHVKGSRDKPCMDRGASPFGIHTLNFKFVSKLRTHLRSRRRRCVWV